MSRAQLGVVVFILALGPVRLAASGEDLPYTASDPLGAIEIDYRAGNLTPDQKAILQITAIKNPEQLPPEYQVFDLAAGKTGSRSATPAILEIIRNWEQLSPVTQDLVSGYLARPAPQFAYDSPSGFFRLHYDTLGEDAVPTADTNGNSVPDFVERCAAYCDTTRAKHDLLGYRAPPSDTGLGGDEKFDVYFEEMEGYYGYAIPEDPGPEEWNDYYGYLVLNSDFLDFPPNQDPEGSVAGAAKATIAHEFHHCVQFAYDADEPLWLMELDAVYMEDIVFDHVNDNYNFLWSFFDYPEKSLMEISTRMYGSFVWGMYLAQRFDTSLMVSIWDGARYDGIFDVLSDTLLQSYGWTQDSAFAEFTCWNYITYHRDDGLHHDEAAGYPLVAIGRTHDAYPTYQRYSPQNPAGYGACYVQFRPAMSEGNLRILFDGHDSREWAAYVVKSVTDNQHELEKFVLSPGSYEGVIEVYGFHDYQSVTLVGINLSEFSSGASYAYSGELFGDYAVASVILTEDSAVYSGAPRNFEYRVYNTSPLNDVYDIIGWDSSGWVVPDVISKFLAPGDSAAVQIPVHPPAGTPLGGNSDLYFKAVSRSDSSVYDVQTGRATTVVQRGDADFDGLVDISDLTHIIRYLYLSDSEPQPVMESGDFDCRDGVDISDVTALIRFLYIDRKPCPCNPF